MNYEIGIEVLVLMCASTSSALDTSCQQKIRMGFERRNRSHSVGGGVKKGAVI